MKLKFRIIFFVGTLLVTLFIVKLSSDPNSWVSWYVGTTKSELWAISQRLENSPPKLSQQGVNHNSFSHNELISVASSSVNSTTTQIARNSDSQNIPENFPLGWYDSITNLDTLPRIAGEGMNMVMPYIGQQSIQEVRAYLDRAAAAGIKVMVEIPRNQVRRDHRWLITQFVKQLKTHPAVLGWYLFDEPEFIKLSPRILERVYRAIKAEDPHHTVAIAFGKLIHIKKYIKALDTVIYFKYPCYYDSPKFCGLENGIFRKLTSTAAFLAKQQDHFWMALQGYGENEDGSPTKFNRRLPSIAEERYMVYSAILAQADGLFFWTHYRSQQRWINSVLTPIVKELKNYLPTITSSNLNHQLVTDNPHIQAVLYQDLLTQNSLIIAINHSSKKLQTAIAIKQNIKANSAQVINSEKSININQGLLTNTFEPYAVQIYQLK